MPLQEIESRWQDRVCQIKSNVDAIRFYRRNGDELSQDEEWCEITIDGVAHRIRFHDYHELYSVPGLYEQLFCERLECWSGCFVKKVA